MMWRRKSDDQIAEAWQNSDVATALELMDRFDDVTVEEMMIRDMSGKYERTMWQLMVGNRYVPPGHWIVDIPAIGRIIVSDGVMQDDWYCIGQAEVL